VRGGAPSSPIRAHRCVARRWRCAAADQRAILPVTDRQHREATGRARCRGPLGAVTGVNGHLGLDSPCQPVFRICQRRVCRQTHQRSANHQGVNLPVRYTHAPSRQSGRGTRTLRCHATLCHQRPAQATRRPMSQGFTEASTRAHIHPLRKPSAARCRVSQGPQSRHSVPDVGSISLVGRLCHSVGLVQ